MTETSSHPKEYKDGKPTTAIILAGGLGLRLRPAVSDLPKVLAPTGGRPFLDYVLTYLNSQGIRSVVLSIGYLAEQVRKFAGNGELWGLSIIYNEEVTPLGTGGALRQASLLVNASPFFTLNGDTLFLVDLQTLWEFHQAAQAAATLALRRVDQVESTMRGCVSLSRDGRIVAFDEKPNAEKRSTQNGKILTNGGVYVINEDALDNIQPGDTASLEHQVFPHLASKGVLAGVIQQGYFADIGTQESLAAFEKDLKAGFLPALRNEYNGHGS